MINPHLLKAEYVRGTDPRTHGKVYFASFRGRGGALFRKQQFRTASAALTRAQVVLARWKQLYDAALAEEQTPA